HTLGGARLARAERLQRQRVVVAECEPGARPALETRRLRAEAEARLELPAHRHRPAEALHLPDDLAQRAERRSARQRQRVDDADGARGRPERGRENVAVALVAALDRERLGRRELEAAAAPRVEEP